jgi:penicillin amidase
VAKQLGIPPQNFVSGDSSGNIGWTIAGQIPIRSGADARVPADWSDGSGWSGWLSSEDYPQVFNPPSGRIWTANSRVVDSEALRKIGDGGYDLGARASQIRDGLFEKNRFVETDMLAIQVDDRALFLARWRDLLLQVLDDEAISERAGRAKYRGLVENWIPRASGDSAGYRIVRAFRLETRAKVFDMLTASVRSAHGKDIELQISKQFEGPLWQLIHEEPAHMLASNYQSWRGLLLSAVDQNIEYFAANWSDGLENRTWSERNTAAIRHPLSRALPLLSTWLDMPREPLSGDSNMPKAMSPTTGASERYGVSPGDEENGYLHMPAGQSGHPLSDFYRAGHDDWVKVRPSSFLPGEARYRLVISPDTG